MKFRYESGNLRSYNMFFIVVVNKKIENILNSLDSPSRLTIDIKVSLGHSSRGPKSYFCEHW